MWAVFVYAWIVSAVASPLSLWTTGLSRFALHGTYPGGVAQLTRVCTYDRAGLGDSDSDGDEDFDTDNDGVGANQPRTSQIIIDQLDRLLKKEM